MGVAGSELCYVPGGSTVGLQAVLPGKKVTGPEHQCTGQKSTRDTRHAYFLGKAMKTSQVAKRQWILLGLYLVLLLFSISLTI